ncbi:major facilitator superfamily domain-containing protein [Neurospora hispaniola]|uniref:Major facilitator superfamily domain-containing protein n=1 Tax=Neurospora hispaniola TaxID=588809 RepID=A0AAJ0IHW2_9PEZI|nr:major facilitator superfamily domain-containing protein [Neurospora hispaniola]
MEAYSHNHSPDVPDRGPAVFVVTTVTICLATLFVVARMVSRIGIVRRVGWDDYIIILAWLISLALSITIDMATRRGLGRHDVDIHPQHRPGLRMCEYVFSILYNPALMATKTSILVFYLRLAKNTQKVLRMASWAVLVIVNVAGTILTFMNIFQCSPLRAAWDITVESAKCLPLLTEFICSAPVNIVTDLAILALPIPVLTGMRLPPRQKTILILTFTLGIFVSIVDVVRIYYLQQAVGIVSMNFSDDPSAIYGQSVNFPWNASFSLMWSAVEVNVGIICACIPTLKPLIIRILPAMIIDPDGTRSSTRDRDAAFKRDNSDSSQPVTSSTLSDSHASAPQAPEQVRLQNDRLSDEISIRDFLAASATKEIPAFEGRTPTFPDRRRFSSAQENSIYFGFVEMKKPKSMVKSSVSESLKYCTIVSILFFLWGFSYGLLNTLNNVVANVAHMSTAQALGLTSVYFGGGYLLGPLLVGGWLLCHDEHRRFRRRRRGDIEPIGGFKATFIVGMLIYGVGTIMFWPCAVLSAYGGFMASSFVVGFGLAVLETAANPFLVLCGPPEYADMRLLLAQGVQAVGAVLSGVLANNVFFHKIEERKHSPTTLLDVQWTYLTITLLCVLLALFFYYSPLPEVTDRELGRLSERLPVEPKKRSIGGVSLRTWCILLAVFSQWFYVAAQENMSVFFTRLMTTFSPTHEPYPNSRPEGFEIRTLNYLVVSHTAFAISRFIAAYLCYLHVKRGPTSRFIPTPRTILSICAALATVFILVTVVYKPASNPNLMAIPIILFFFFEGPIWPLIFSLGMRGQGKRTKQTAAWLTMGGSGPAFWPFVSYAILQRGARIQTSFIVVVILMAMTMVYPLFLTFVRDAREMSDHVMDTASQKRRRSGDVEDGGGGLGGLGGRGVFLSERRGSENPMTLDQIIAQRQRERAKAAQKAARAENGGMLKRLSRSMGIGAEETPDENIKDEKRRSQQQQGQGQGQMQQHLQPEMQYEKQLGKKTSGEDEPSRKDGESEEDPMSGADEARHPNPPAPETPEWERQTAPWDLPQLQLDTRILED